MPSPLASLELLFQPWAGAADDDEMCSRYFNIDSNDQASVIAAAKEDLLPHFTSLHTTQHGAIMSALLEIQSLSKYQIERFWNGMLPPFHLPDKSQNLFIWIAEALASESPIHREVSDDS